MDVVTGKHLEKLYEEINKIKFRLDLLESK